MTATIHAQLDRKELLPAEHIVDTGYVDAKILVESQRDYHIDLVGPTRKNYRWQATRAFGLRCQSLSHRLGAATGDLDSRDTRASAGRARKVRRG